MRKLWGAMCVIWCMAGCETKPQPVMSQAATIHTAQDTAKKKRELIAARQGFTSSLKPMKGYEGMPTQPPEDILTLTQYKSPIGPMHAYVSPPPKDDAKHPIVIWKTGGFSNALSSVWHPANPENDQTAAQYRKHGLLMMYPSVRGAHNNPGQFEGFYGEVDDMIAAITFAKSLDYVDPDRVYLAGHSTGATLALLTAAAAPKELALRGVFALGPVAYVSNYGQDGLPFNVQDDTEDSMRAPIEWLHAIHVPTHLIEGVDGNSSSVIAMMETNNNPLVTAYIIPDHDHFSIIAGVNDIIAQKIKADTKDTLSLTPQDFNSLLTQGSKVDHYSTTR